jgi:hypothetical protein
MRSVILTPLCIRSSKYKDKEGRSLLFVLNNPDHSPTLQRKHRAQVHNNNNNNTTSNATTSGRSTVQDTATPTPYPEGMTPHPDQDDKGTRDEPILWRLRTTISVLKVRYLIVRPSLTPPSLCAASSQTRRRTAPVEL